MTGMLTRLRCLLGSKHYEKQVKELSRERHKLDTRIGKLERKATLEDSGEWFIGVIRRDPSCAIKSLRECDRNENHG